ncbi:alpha/beta hydrolase [Histidinibacterium lentulum]|uniref:alpha/beta fold hydrolase n=1 Tax=Histidinibacterium lentulum TaxID=2480588 RepID=UPI00319DA065
MHFFDEGAGPPVLCLAGLTRNADDFAHVLPHLGEHRVIRLDARGRGRSERPADFTTYNVLREGHDAMELIDHLGLDRVAIIGTSRGGLVAMTLAASHRERLSAVVLNDIGPIVGVAGLARIMGYVGREPDLPDLAAGARALAEAEARSFPDVPPDRWAAEAAARWEETPEGLRNRYDPALHTALMQQSAAGALPDLWMFFEALREVPTGAIRGANSDILSAETLEEMQRRHPGLVSATVPDRGHVPFLDEPASLGVISRVIGGSA